MKFLDEFKAFAMKGNVADMAVGIIIGAAFGKIVNSAVTDVLMPPLGYIIGGVDFSALEWTFKPQAGDLAAVSIKYGIFINAVISFIIVALATFLLIRGMNALRTREEEKPSMPRVPSHEEALLVEIRDLLKKK
jgi:large conductance mechanosensitive channel